MVETSKEIKKDNKNGKNRTHWLCQCDCGNPKLASVTGHQLKSGHTQSCGCYASEQIAKRNKKYSKANPDTHENGVSEFVYCANGHKRIESNLDDSRRIMI